MLAQEREPETQKARLEVLERFTSEHLNDAMRRLPAETRNLHERLTSLEESSSKAHLDERTLTSMIDNHQEWQSQVQAKLADLTADQQSKDLKTIELLDAHSTEAHSRNDRLEDKLIRLERQVEEQRKQILHLEAIPRMAEQECNTPEKRTLFQEPGQSSQSHSQNDPPGNSTDPNQGQVPNPPHSHSRNDQGGTDCAALQENHPRPQTPDATDTRLSRERVPLVSERRPK